MDELDSRVFAMLGGRTPAQFASLPTTERHAALRRHLVRPGEIIVDDGDQDVGDHLVLRQHYFVGDDAAGRQLVEEATRLYYAENTFRVPLYWLSEFMTDRLPAPDGMEGISVAPLVRKDLIVEVGLRGSLSDGYPDPDEKRAGLWDPSSVHYRHGVDKEARWIQASLQDLLVFTNARRVTIALVGGGVLDGSDLATHQTIKDISFVVKLLLERLGDRLDITKAVERQGRVGRTRTRPRSLRMYWVPPKMEARDMVRDGEEATFEELAQVEIEEWTRISTTIGSNMNREWLTG